MENSQKQNHLRSPLLPSTESDKSKNSHKKNKENSLETKNFSDVSLSIQTDKKSNITELKEKYPRANNYNKGKPKWKKGKGKYKKKVKRKHPKGTVNIRTTFNNTILTVTNLTGNVLSWYNAGRSGFKGARKSTPFAAKTAAGMAAKQSIDKKLKQVTVMVKGTGPGRESALRGLIENKMILVSLRDGTGLPHNGCRPPKKRRV